MALSRGRKSQLNSLHILLEKKIFKIAVYLLNWVGRESRPEACGVASILSSRVKEPCVEDLILVNKAIALVRGSACMPLIFWKPPKDNVLVAVSDFLGPGTAAQRGAQGVQLILAAEPGVAHGVRAKVTLLS